MHLFSDITEADFLVSQFGNNLETKKMLLIFSDDRILFFRLYQAYENETQPQGYKTFFHVQLNWALIFNCS